MSRPGGPPQGPPHGQPLSFKTVPGRNRTQKWQQAKTYNYDGDDWGGYDPYDEYSGYDDQSYHAPGPAPRAGRTTSFDRGDERRNFSAGPVLYEDAAGESASMANADQIRTRPRDFTNPEQVPPPLSTRGAPPATSFPPRKSSIGSDAQPQSSSSAEAEKPLPFIRPSDIYKRIPEEREKEKQSLDSARPSMDSIRREGNSIGSMSNDNLPQNLTSVVETAEPETPLKATFSPSATIAQKEPAQTASIPTSLPQDQTPSVVTAQPPTNPGPLLPEVSRFSGFGSDFWSGTKPDDAPDNASQLPAGAQPVTQPVSTAGGNNAVDLQHQPSFGLRSVVHTAFERQSDNSVPPTPASGHDSSGGGVSRSNTDSTSGISPIMSRVPSAATAQQKQQEINTQVPPIEEEPTSANTPVQSRHPSYVPESRVTSGEIPIGVQGFQPGYRRSLDPPSQENSRAMTPQIEDTTNRRLSGPMAASVETAEPSANASMTELKSVSSGNSRMSDSIEEYTKALPVGARGRSGTNYSLREADLANAVSAAPSDPSFSPEVSHAETASREQFLREHEEPPSTSLSPVKTTGLEMSPSGMTSDPDSPTKGRVRDLAGKYQEINDASRRGSQASLGSRKSSWSQFRGSDENLASKRQQAEDATSETVQFPEYDNSGSAASKPSAAPAGSLASARPGVDSQQSFRPQIPGGWESSAPTPAVEEPPPTGSATPGGSLAPPRTPAEEIDLSPTTEKLPLIERGPHASNLALQSAGAALGASLVASAGLNSQAQDFASNAPAAQVDQPEMRSKPAIGTIASPQPPLLRGDSEITDAPTSKASSRAPTPPTKDVSSNTADKEGDEYSNSSIPPTVPLKYGSSRRGTNERATGHLEPDTPYDVRHLSTEAGAGDTESDRLRKEIVRSLGSSEDMTSDNAVRVQDALDASARPAETSTTSLTPNASLRPHLQQRFSWEDPTYDANAPAPVMSAQAMPSHLDPKQFPDILPEMPYERPRSRGLHIVNTQAGDGTVGETPTSPNDAQVHSALALNPSEHKQAHDLADVPSSPHVADRPSAEASRGYGMDVKAPIPDDDDAHLKDLEFAPVSPISPLVSEKPQLEAPDTPTKQSPTSPRPGSGGQRIPAFREILTIKSPAERITAYNQTRQTFAQMDTGLSGWLSNMAQHPEHANLQPAPIADYKRPGIQTAGIGTFGRHKHSPSLMKFTNQFRGSPSEGSASAERKTSVSGAAPDPVDSAPMRSTPSNSWGGESEGRRMNVDMDKMQQRGKDLIKNAGVLGGKAQAGAKGLFAKGKSRFGGKRETTLPRSSKERPFATQPAAVVVPESASLVQPSASTTAIPEAQTDPSFAVNAPTPRRFTPTPSPLRGIEVPRSQSNTPSSFVAPSRDVSQSPAPSRPKGPSRSQTHTPSSHSRSLSQTWSRLSRSMSRSSRSRSRPTSMIVTGHESSQFVEPTDLATTALPIPTDDEVSSNMRASPQPKLGPETTASAPGRSLGDERRETWDETDFPALQMAKIPEVMLERLGVLPSPSGQSSFDRPFTADTQKDGRSRGEYASSEHDKTPTKPPKMNLPGSRSNLVSQVPTSPLEPHESDELDEDLYSATPTAPKRMEDELNNEAPARLEEQPRTGRPLEDAGEHFKTFPESGMTALGAAAALQTSPDDSLERASQLSEDEDFVDAHDHLAPAHVEECTFRPSPVSEQELPNTTTDGADAQTDVTNAEDAVLQERPISPLPLEDTSSKVPDDLAVEAGIPLQPRTHEGRASDQDGFMKRSYRTSNQTSEERPLSFMLAPRDAQGVPFEQINSNLDPPNASTEAIPVDLSRISGPPPPREPAPVDLSGLDGPPPGARDFDRQAWNPNAQRYGHSRRAPSLGTHRVSDHWGLEGLVTSGPDAVGGDDEPPPEERRRRTSSGVWQKITGAKTRPDSREEAVPVPTFDPPEDNVPKSGKLSKKNKQAVERSATTTVSDSNPREKKGFSKLGSLFGRSTTTTGRSTPPGKTNKLTKRENLDREEQRPAMPTSNDSSFQGPVEGYAAYERLRKQQVLGYTVQAPRQSFERSGPRPNDRMTDNQYSPMGEATVSVGRGGAFRQPSYSRIPEAFRPTETGFVRGPEPIGPPPDPLSPPPMNQQPTLPIDHPSWTQRSPDLVPEHSPHDPRQISYSSQRSGQSRFQDADWNTTPDLQSPQDEIARSPAREYRDQQTPWAISLPRRSEEQRRLQHPSRGPSWTEQSGHLPQSTEPWTGAVSHTTTAQSYYQQFRGPPVYSPSSSPPGAYPLPPQSQHVPPGQQHYRRASSSMSHAPYFHPANQRHAPHSRSVSGPDPNRNNYPPIQTQGFDPQAAGRGGSYYSGSASGGGRHEGEDGDGDAAPMSATTYPGQEWVPKGI